jgi:hypothetical protein
MVASYAPIANRWICPLWYFESHLDLTAVTGVSLESFLPATFVFTYVLWLVEPLVWHLDRPTI